MKTPAFPFALSILCAVSVSFASPSPARAADGPKLLASVSHLQAQNASEQALEGANKQRELLQKRKQVAQYHAQLEGAAATPVPTDPSVSLAQQIVDDIAALAAFESTASGDGLDDAERERLRELVGIAQKSVDAALADAKRQMTAAKTSEDKELAKLQLRSLRATMKAHRQTASALRTLAKRVAV